MRNLKKIVEIALVIAVSVWLITEVVNLYNDINNKTATVEQNFIVAAKELTAQLNNGQAKIVGPKKIERINGVVQTEWLLISPVRYNKNSFYAFKILNLPLLNGLERWVVLPYFYSHSSKKLEDWLGYYIEIYDDQLFDPGLFNNTYYHEYKNEPFYSTFQLLKKFVEWRNNQENQAKH